MTAEGVKNHIKTDIVALDLTPNGTQGTLVPVQSVTYAYEAVKIKH